MKRRLARAAIDGLDAARDVFMRLPLDYAEAAVITAAEGLFAAIGAIQDR